MSQTELKVGIVGCGGISRAHVQAYRQAADAHITQVFDVHRPNAEKLGAELGVTVADSVEAMAKAGELDAVSICTPPNAHLENALPFLRAGIAVLCEKPFEVNLERAQELAAAVRESGSVFMIAFCHRFHPWVREARRLLTEEREMVGEPLFFRNFFGGIVDITAGHRSQPQVSGGGALIDNCSHSLDIFRFLVGDIESVQARIANVAQTAQVEDFASLDMQGVGGAVGQIASSYSMPVIYNAVELFCSRSTITVNYGVAGRPDLVLHVAGQEARAIELPASVERFTAEVACFLDCLRNGASPSPGIDDAMASALAIDAAYRSAREGRRIKLEGALQTV